MTTAQRTKKKAHSVSPVVLVSHKKRVKPWGLSASIDLHDCDHLRLNSKKLLREFVMDVIKVIDMEAHGPCHIDRFGAGNLEGYSAIQFIETSSITVHLDEKWDRAFIDIFSCKDFDTDRALQFCKNYFGAGKSKMTVLER